MVKRKIAKASKHALDALKLHFDQQSQSECLSPGHSPLVPLTWSARSELEAAAKEREARRQRVTLNRTLKQKLREKRTLSCKAQWDKLLCNVSPSQLGRKRPRPANVIKLCRSGIPAFLRGSIWLAFCEDQLKLTPEMYASYVNGANQSSIDQLAVDIPRTFPHLAFYHTVGSPLSAGMVEVLTAYTEFDKETGYIQGMTYIAGVLLLYLSPYEAFSCMANMMHSNRLFQNLRNNAEVLEQFLNDFDAQLKIRIPTLYQHFLRLGITSDMYLLDWIFTIFSKSLPLNVVARIWDCYLACTSEEAKESLLWEISIGILRLLQPLLLEKDVSFILRLLKVLPESIDEDDYLDAILE